MATLEERIQALEDRLAVTPAAVPPMTIGELANVPVPGSAIAAQWAQDVSSRVVQRFPNGAAITAWAAPVGTFAVTLDNGVLYRRVAAGWARYTPYSATQIGVPVAQGSAGAGTFTIATISIPADPGNRVLQISNILRVDKFQPAGNIAVQILADGAGLGQIDLSSEKDNSVIAGHAHVYYANMGGLFNTTPGVPTTVVLQVVSTAAAGEWFIPGAASMNRLDVLAVPRGV